MWLLEEMRYAGIIFVRYTDKILCPVGKECEKRLYMEARQCCQDLIYYQP